MIFYQYGIKQFKDAHLIVYRLRGRHDHLILRIPKYKNYFMTQKHLTFAFILHDGIIVPKNSVKKLTVFHMKTLLTDENYATHRIQVFIRIVYDQFRHGW